MKTRDVVGSLFGGLVIYVAMAACSGSNAAQSGATASKGTSTGAAGNGGAGAGSGGASTGSGGAQGAGGAVAQGGAGGVGKGGAGGIFDAGAIFDALTDPVSPANADPVSGARLKAKFRTGDDGSKEYLGNAWYDSGRNEDCSFALAADGKERCLPGAPVTAFGGVATAVFKDAACSVPIYFVTNIDPKCMKAGFTVRVASSSCADTTIHVVQVGAPLAGWYTLSNGVCTGGPWQGSPHYEGVEVAPSAFVSATVGHDP